MRPTAIATASLNLALMAILPLVNILFNAVYTLIGGRRGLSVRIII